MNLKRLADKARQTIDKRGGSERLKQDAQRLQSIAGGGGSAKQKAKAAADALKEQPAAKRSATPAEKT